MQCYTELIPPTAVTHAVSLPFLDQDENNLVIAKTSLLQIFQLRGHATHRDEDETRSSDASKSKLVLVGEYPLAGTVTSLASIKVLNTKSGGDALIIAFKDAKLSLVEWDPDNYKISTISIHYYEGENVPNPPFGPSLGDCHSILTVDPSSRCAALKFGARHLAILPFRQQGDELGEGAEEGYDLEMDVEPPSATLKGTQAETQLNGTKVSDTKQTPYKASFVLPLTALDLSLSHTVNLAFLHEYREPTFGILSASLHPSSALLEERTNILSYTVFTLDLEQRASTNLISVQRLPSDLWKVVPLPLPVGGALLLGTNEFVHVDQSGKTNAVLVNEFARMASGFSTIDQSSLNMKLENCEVEILDINSGDLLIVLDDGSLAILQFRLSGRNVRGLSVTRVSPEQGSTAVEAAPSCLSALTDNMLFVGSEDGSSTLVSWTKPTASLSRKRSHAQMLRSDAAVDEEENSEDIEEDDLYASASEPTKRTESFSFSSQVDPASSYNFELSDTIPSLAPINNICFGRSSAMPAGKLEFVAATGRGVGSRLAFMSREVIPEILGSTTFSNTKNAWSLRIRPQAPGEDVEPSLPNYDNLFCVYDGESTKIHDIVNTSDELGDKVVYSERSGTDFESEGETLAVSTLAKGTRIVQCRRNDIIVYDSDLALTEIKPMIDEETEAELKIVHTSFCDPYLLVLRDDSSVAIFKADESGEIEALDSESSIKASKWLSGCLYTGELFENEVFAFLLGDEGGLNVFRLPDLVSVYTAPALSYLPALLSSDAPQRRIGAKETLTEILFANIGSEHGHKPYLVLRSAIDDLTLYEPWMNGVDPLSSNLRFRKVPFYYTPKFDETIAEESDGRPAPLQAISAGGHQMVYVHGGEPTLLVKEDSSQPKAIGVRTKSVAALVPLNHQSCEDGFGLIDSDGTLCECQLPTNTEFSSGWSVKRMTLGDPVREVRHIGFHDEKQLYVVATCRDVDFQLSEEDGRHHEQEHISLRPQVPRFTLHLLSANARGVIHSFEMPYLETITSLKIMPLEVSEQTHEQKLMVVVGTGLQRGEDMPAKGAITVFEIQEVVPEPDRPESEYKLHVVAREDTKGAVTAVESFPGGLVGTGQGQKIMIRGLKEDGSCLPVAFLDAQCYTTQLKTFQNSGMFLAGDAWKGVWFGGFTEEPYKLSILGKSRTRMEIVASEFLPFDGQLFVLVMDAQMDLHVLQYDPENPKSLSGTRLLHRSTIHVGHFPSSMTLLPSTLTPMSKEEITNGDAPLGPALHQVLTTSTAGSMGLITPLDEASYRRLGSIQTHLTSVLEHAAGLNPKAYRAVESEGFGSRGIIDGSLVRRISELGSARRSEVLGRAVADAWAFRSDLEIVGGGGLGYL